MPREELPIGACIFSASSGALLAVEGGLLALASTATTNPVLTSVSSSLGAAGAIDVFEGVVLILLAFGLLFNPRSHTGIGIAVLTFALLSVFTGGGFYLGALLGFLGGVLGIIFKPRLQVEASDSQTSEEEFDDPVEEADLVDAGVLPRDAVEEPPAAPGPSRPA